MPALETPPVVQGWKAADFSLKDTDGVMHTPQSLMGEKGLVVMFICNHCPFVKAILPKLVSDMRALKTLGVNAVAIMPNDVANYPDDAPEHMKKLAEEWQFPFPYLYDETQSVAKAYDAVCTPDFFGFDNTFSLQYRGRLDDSGRETKPDSTRELFLAMEQMAETGTAPATQKPSIGCSIKWKA